MRSDSGRKWKHVGAVVMPLGWVGLVALGSGVLRAETIVIQNASFESPATSTHTSEFDVDRITSWIVEGSGAGVWNINASPYGLWTVPAPEGNQVAFISPAQRPGDPGSISQVLGASLRPNTHYTLAGKVGHPIGFGSTRGTTYTVELLAGSSVLKSISGTGPEGSFASFLLAFDSTGSNSIGEALQIMLSSSGAQTAFDAITLDATADTVPEIDAAGMGSVLALLAGAIGLLERRRLSSGTVRSAVPLCDHGFPAENRSS